MKRVFFKHRKLVSEKRSLLDCAFIAIVFCGVSPFLWATELPEYFRSSRSMGMGGTSTAFVEGTDSLFLNPAGLATTESAIFKFAQSDTSLSDDILFDIRQNVSTYASLGISGVGKLMGKNIATQEQIVTAWAMPGLAVGLLVDAQIALRMKDKVYPKLELGYQTTQGVQVGTGVSLMRGRHGRSDLRAGASVKVMFRRGGFKNLPLIDLFNINVTRLQAMAGNFGLGIGVDTGLQYEKKLDSVTSILTGIAMTNIGDTTFASPQADAMRSNLSFGLAYKWKPRLAEYIFAYDYRNVGAVSDWRKKNHFGLQMKWPILSLYGGVNQIYFSYGIGIDVWVMNIMAYSYAEELGTFVRQNIERRWVLQMTFQL